MAHEGLFDSFAAEKAECILFLVELIKQFISPSRALRLLGNMLVREPQNPAFQQFNQMNMMELTKMLSQAYSMEYDAEISQKPFEPSVKYGMAQMLGELANEGRVQVPPDILIDAWVEGGILTSEIGNRWKQSLAQAAQAQAQATLGGAAAGGPALQAQAQAVQQVPQQ